MEIVLTAVLAAAALVLLISFICFFMAFYVPESQKHEKEEYPIPHGKDFLQYRDTMVGWIKEVRALPHEDMYITSFDGLTLHARYYEYCKGATTELMMHGYRGSAERDMCGGVQRCFALGRNALIVDQRASGESGGHVITFGVNESRDCLSWVEYMIKRFGGDVKIILTGISMGAATVVTAAGNELPDNVVGVLADCGYTTAREMIEKTIREMHLPARLLYPFVQLGARIYGGFKLDKTSPAAAIKNCRVPIIFFHGEADRFVPCYMSEQLYNECTAPKKLVTVPGAGHGMSYLVDSEGYLNALAEFWTKVGVNTTVIK